MTIPIPTARPELAPTNARRRVADFMQTEILSCAPNLPLAQAAEMMRARNCGSILIVAEACPVGIWTERDAARLDFADPSVLDTRIGAVMSSPVRTIAAEAEAGEAILCFQESQLRHLVVVDAGGTLQGIISQTDLALRHGIEPFLRLRTVGEIIKRGFVRIDGTLSLAEAARKIANSDYDAAVVDCGQSELGILTERDLLRLVATRDTQTTVCAAATHPLRTIGADGSLLEARRLLIDGHIRHLGVTAINGEVVGLLSLHEILELLERDYTVELMTAIRQVDEEQRIAAIAFESSAPMILTDVEARILRVNRAFCEMTGYSREEVIGQTPRILKSNRHPPDFYAILWEHLRDTGNWRGEIWNRRKNGEIYPEWLSIEAVRDLEGRVTHYVGTIEDISIKVEAENRLRLAASVFEHSREGIMVTDVKRVIIDVNAAFTEITGYTRDEVIGKNSAVLRSGLQNKAFYAEMRSSIKRQGTWQGEVWNRRKDGEVYAELLTISTVPDETGSPKYFVGMFSDITPKKRQEQKLEHLANHDVLTGLPNRRLLDDRLTIALARRLRRQDMLAVCLLDLDDFKPVNDTHGHQAGDTLLKTIAHRLQLVMRDEDTVARIGGDEFVLLIGEIQARRDCEEILSRIVTTMSESVDIGDQTVHVGCSIGVTLVAESTGNSDAQALLMQADAALYAAKAAGKSRFAFHHNEADTA